MSLTIPNLLSLLRMGLVPVFIIAVLDGEMRKALLVFAVAGVTDALDGFIARFWHQQSLLGAYLDPIADKLLLTSAYISLSIPTLNHGLLIPVWITVLVIARDVLLVIVALVMYLAVGVRSFPPTILGKITTVSQVAAVVLVLLAGPFPNVETVALGVLYLMTGLTVASGLNYVFRSNRLIESRPRA
ncbi:MAG TPA: CDP-alcohol phosphatidyltransferase family protein [Thermoanaerobaculia bacterium]|nr:CDP-alcohol phosphatidyltransferase family protein [Thermoanaerobaculia bacterium]